jgi:uncharacterized protein (DUF342 family)
MLVKAQIIGAPTRSKTVAIAGADPMVHERLEAITKIRSAALDKFLNVDKLLKLAHANPGRVPAEAVKAAKMTQESINTEIAALNLEEAELRKAIAASNEARIVAEKQFLEGVEVRFGLHRQTVVTDREGGVFELKEGELTFI